MGGRDVSCPTVDDETGGGCHCCCYKLARVGGVVVVGGDEHLCYLLYLFCFLSFCSSFPSFFFFFFFFFNYYSFRVGKETLAVGERGGGSISANLCNCHLLLAIMVHIFLFRLSRG